MMPADRINNGAPRHCSYEAERMDKLIDCMTDIAEAVKTNAEEIKVLSGYHRDMIRWLLGVVCIIALGNKALDLAKAWTSEAPAHAEAKP